MLLLLTCVSSFILYSPFQMEEVYYDGKNQTELVSCWENTNVNLEAIKVSLEIVGGGR